MAVAALLAVSGVVFLLVRSDDDKPKARASRALPVTSQRDTGAVALASLLTRSRGETYHATYTSSGNLKVSGGSVTMEIWNKKGKSRVDTTLTTADRQVHTASILTGGKAVVCQKSTADWTCSSAPAANSGGAVGLVAALQGQLSGRAVSENAAKVDNRQARCFQVAATAGAEQLGVCVDPHRGILLKLSSSEAQIQIDKLDSSVPDNAFDPPAAAKS
ncbi:MAG: hypothetical protein QOJ00_1945 [Actinomycetota bacterium]